eukprot:scaffold2997_cov182-Amphora_coffeaeformis.AAC.7
MTKIGVFTTNGVLRETKIGACCVVRDDNHWLIEWLAYHYTTLPLTHLILAVDPKSKTSPQEILTRWKSRIKIKLWRNWTNIDVPSDAVEATDTERFRNRQKLTYTKCLKKMKAQGVDWVLLTDTDEFIRPGIGYMRLSDQLESRQDNIAGKKCITVPRYEVSSNDVDRAHSNRRMLTTRFFFRENRPILDRAHLHISGKNIVNVKALNESDININKIPESVHEILPYCGLSQAVSQDLPMIYHYAGTLEQFSYRDDVRNEKERKKHNFRGNHADLLDTSLSSWIGDFVRLVGPDEARYLLDGVGEVGWQVSNHSTINAAQFFQTIGYSVDATSTEDSALSEDLSPLSLDNHSESAISSGVSDDSRATTLHVLMGLSGSDAGFLSEVEIALKSILINAPLERDMQVHFLADSAACKAVLQVLRRIDVASWRTRNKISFVLHNVESRIERWIDKINHVYENERKEKNVFRHTIGAYFRLFANEILDGDVQNVLYMDSDVVIVANLDELWRHANAEKVFHWGKNSLCSGFMIMNVQKLAEIWDRMPLLGPWKPTDTPGDQIILRSFHSKFPEMVGSLPIEWDISARNGFMGNSERSYLKSDPRKVAEWLKSGAGMLHFNGGGESAESYYKVHPQFSGKYNDTFGLAKFYVDIPWPWVRFLMKSMTRHSISYAPLIVEENRSIPAHTMAEDSFGPPLVSTLSDDTGIVGPVDLSAVLFSAMECTRQFKNWGNAWKTELVSRPYVKSPFAYKEACREMALHSDLVKEAQALIGHDDIMVASMSPLSKPPGWQHRWHSDVESVVDASCTEHVWTAWLPAWGGSEEAGLHFITHTSNSSVLAQTYLEELGLKQCKSCEESKDQKRFEEVGEVLLLHAKTQDENSRYIRVPAKFGQAWFFKGTTFHGSINRSDETRQAFQFHFMPSNCRFRRHRMERNTWPHPEELIKELPVVIPVLGNASSAPFVTKGADTGHGIEPFPLNNWLFPDMRKPEKVFYKYDRTNHLVRKAIQHIVNLPQVFSFENDWIDLPCTKEGDSASGIIDMTKCKQPMFEGGTRLLRHMEYHASQLRKNSAAHSLRFHEEFELLYVARGKVILSLAQTAPHDSVLYRKEVTAGGLAFYPAWQAHGVTAVEEPQAAYIAIRWIGKASEELVPASSVKLWEDLDSGHIGHIKPTEVSELQNLSVVVQTVGNEKALSTLSINAGEDTLVLATRGSIGFQGKEIKSPGTVFIPSTDEPSTADIVEVFSGGRALVVRIRPKHQ